MNDENSTLHNMVTNYRYRPGPGIRVDWPEVYTLLAAIVALNDVERLKLKTLIQKVKHNTITLRYTQEQSCCFFLWPSIDLHVQLCLMNQTINVITDNDNKP